MSPSGKPGSHHPAQLLLVCAPLTKSPWKGRLLSASRDKPMPTLTISPGTSPQSQHPARLLAPLSPLQSSPVPGWLLLLLSSLPTPLPYPCRVPHCEDTRGSCHQTQHMALVQSQVIPTVLSAIMQGLHTHKNWFELLPSSPPIPFWHFQIYSSHYRSVWDSSLSLNTDCIRLLGMSFDYI